jgi:leucyl aminopeptidase (aminopeptidase T)
VAAKNAIKYVLDAVPNERLAIICDAESRDVGRAFIEGGLALGLWTRFLLLDGGDAVRTELPREISDMVVSGSSDIYITIFRDSVKETPFRVKIISLINRYKKYRLGHCPGISMDMLTEGALALSSEEHLALQTSARRLLASLLEVKRVKVTNPNGTDISFSVQGRDFYTDTKYDWKRFKWLNLPTGEVIAGPVENSLNGTLVCDLAVGGIGPISSPITIIARNGRAERFDCSDRSLQKWVESALSIDQMARHVGEFAFGLNGRARLSANFLEAEKYGGTIHIAFGNNEDYPGGMNNSATHMDFLVSRPTVEVTGDHGTLIVMKEGRLV